MDYRDFKVKGSKEAKDAEKRPSNPPILQNANRFWLYKDDPTYAAAVMSQVGAIIKADRGRIDGYNMYARLYGTFTPTFWNGYQLSNSGRPSAPMRDRLTYNIVQSCIDTVVAMLIQNKPKPMFLTSGGDSKAQTKAKKLDSYCYGLFYENDAYELGATILRDSLVFGEGIVYVYVDENGAVRYERVMPYELLVDYLESHYGPRSTKTMHRVKFIDRTELAEMIPEKKAEIASMTDASQFVSTSNRSVADTVCVIESWRLPVGNQPGVHSLSTANTVLKREEWKHPWFPFAIMRYCPRLYGFYAQGMAEQLLPSQIEINRTLISIQRSLYLGGTHKIFVKAGSKIIKSHFDNMVGTILEYAGDTAPEYIVPQLVQPEVYQHLDSMINRGYMLPGVSQMDASSVKSPGVNSGRAMRTEQNIHTQRHQSLQQRYENFFVDLSKISIGVARDEYAEKKRSTQVRVPGKRFIEKIGWKDVDLEDSDFVMQIYPVSKLPNDPEGRLQTIQEMMQGGLISPQAGQRLLDFPDLEAEQGLANAQRDYLHKILDDIVDHGKYHGPEEDDDLVLARQFVLEYIARGKFNNLAAERMDMLRDFNKQVINLINQASAAANPQAAAPAVVPQAQPAPPPTSDLIPNVPGAAPASGQNAA